MLGIAVAGIGRNQNVRLLRARRHSGGRPAALHVEDHGGNFSEIGKAQKFLHQRNARTRRCGEGARAVPCCADDHADGGDFVLRLDDGEFVLFAVGVDTEFAAIFGEGLGQRGRRRNRIPGGDGGAAVNAAKSGGIVAVDEDAIAYRIGLLHLQGTDFGQILARKIIAQKQRLMIGRYQFFLVLELLADQLLSYVHIHVQQGAKRADINDVLEQLTLARIAIGAVGNFGQRHTDDVDVFAKLR